ncbi:DUF4351 domain-containing protein [Dolichospermum planctonicum CS-1226]|uniref:DUF4351 domain-containing protein n=1 Tax=Dolichospermum planctonicum CS-1226 TaxID=3021751 RepID=A0ABT5AC68_9CYAN|nr:DUF4351 domain-containing protein [Dolichospermum planctonicum]MDB9534367.1 DUF4351 domain-containing protein [Dolichospermum planctonicum CS-1226]
MKSYQDYRVINLWEIEASLVFAENLSSLLPFVPILKGGGEETIVREAVIKLRENEQLRDLEPLLSFFASFVLEIPIVQQIMRWDMTVLRESPWYNEILKQGLQQGLQQGEQQGEANLIIRQLSKRFGNLDPAIASQIRQLSISQLETLGESIFDFSAMADLETWLQQNIGIRFDSVNLLVWSGNREQGTGNTGIKTELIPTESSMATPRKLSKIKYYSYID